MSYFVDNFNLFKLETKDGIGLRKCQLGAVWALKSYQTNRINELASLVSMPTGSGKTALMMASCFELNCKKVLIVVSSKILRRQICEKFETLETLKEIGCLDEKAKSVSVYEVTKRKSSREEWEKIIDKHDVLVAHPNSISPYYKSLSPIPSDLIDTIFMDEAHHEPAVTWQAINSFYKKQLKVFLTATPFRRDKKNMRAKLVYHYTLENALQDKILRPIEFHGTNSGLHEEDYDASLIATAKEIFKSEKDNNENASILIRTDKIKSAEYLLEKYKESGFNVDVIHSNRSPNVNEALVKRVIRNELDGLVCVGIASEGLDIPNLKVAVLHATPRSIPYTIQFLGRISRAPENQIGSAKLIANKSMVRGEVQKLYKSDVAWSKIIPEIVDEQMKKIRHLRPTQLADGEFQMPEINVYFSTLVYQTPPKFDFLKNFTTIDNSDFEIKYSEQEDIDSPLIIITSQNKPLEWANREIYIEDFLDIHIYYHSREHKLLFELTTSELGLNSFKGSLLPEGVTRIPRGMLFKALSGFSQSDYLMVGLRNSALSSASNPAYKTVIGSSVQAAIRSSEGRVFGTGHALLRVNQKNSWGIALRKGRIWAMKRGDAHEFKEWCDKLCGLITDGPVLTNLPGLSFLATSEPNNSIDEIPVAIIPDQVFFKSHSVSFSIKGEEELMNEMPKIIGEKIDENKKKLEGYIEIDNFKFEFIMDFEAEELWEIEDSEKILIHAERNETTLVEKNIEEIFNEFAPSLVMPNGHILVGREKIIPNRTIEDLPDNIWIAKDWSNCNIRSEAFDENPDPNNQPVINHTIDIIKNEFDFKDEDLIFLDDGAHEIADLIYFNTSTKTIHFIHCKYSSEDRPGCRKSDSGELFTQGMRSIHWISSSNLLDRINYRHNSIKNSNVVVGTDEILKSLSDNYRVNDWKFNIIMVQPGFKLDQVSNKERANNNVYEHAIPLYNRILDCDATLEIWGT